MTQNEIDSRFDYHPPKADQASVYEYFRGKMKALAEDINRICPESREKALAMTNLEQAIMWANAAIARNT